MPYTITLTASGIYPVLKNDETGEEVNLSQKVDLPRNISDREALQRLREQIPSQKLEKYEQQIASASISPAFLAHLNGKQDYAINKFVDAAKALGTTFDPKVGTVAYYIQDLGFGVTANSYHLTDKDGDGQWEARVITPQYKRDNLELLTRAESQLDFLGRASQLQQKAENSRPATQLAEHADYDPVAFAPTDRDMFATPKTNPDNPTLSATMKEYLGWDPLAPSPGISIGLSEPVPLDLSRLDPETRAALQNASDNFKPNKDSLLENSPDLAATSPVAKPATFKI